MRIFLKALIISSCFLSCSTPKIAIKDAIVDIDFLETKLVEIHPYFEKSHQLTTSLDSIRECIKNKKYVEQKELFCLLNPVVASLRDGHTRLVEPNSLIIKGFLWGSRIIPIDVNVEGSKILLINNFSKENALLPGSEILSINKVPSKEIINKLLCNKYGESDEMRYHSINLTFSRALWMYMGFNKKYDITYSDTNKVEHKLRLKGIYQPSYYHKWGEKHIVVPNYLIKGYNGGYYETEQGTCGIIEYRSFGGYKDSLFFHNVFDLAIKHKIKHLILDLRDNGGGSTSTYRYILPYLTTDTIQPFSKIEYKYSRELLNKKPFGIDFNYEPIEHLGEIVPIDITSTKIIPFQTDLRYSGHFYCLSNAATYSTASSFCALIQDYHLGTIIGEPTGGMATSFGNFLTTKLPNSQIVFLISTTKFYRSNGNPIIEPIKPEIEFSLKNITTKQILDQIIK
jgi:C-terminal processing protease CtpA/Prc